MSLRKYFLKRMVAAFIDIIIAFLLCFFICYVQLKEAKGLPELQQFSNYLKFVFIDRFGVINIPGRPNTIDYLLQILPYSFFLLLTSAFVAVSFGVILGALAAYKRGSIFDSFLSVFFVTLLMIPNWWLASYLIEAFSRWFPVGHWFTYEMTQIPFWSNPLGKIQDFLWHTTLPTLSLAISIAGIFFLICRNSMINTFSEQYIVTAKAKGLNPYSIIFRHALKNAIIPVTAAIAIVPLFLINALMGVERVYNLDGIGYELYYSMVAATALPRYDILETLPAIFLAFSLIMTVIHFAVDMLNFHLDSRLRSTLGDGGDSAFFNTDRWKSRKAKIKFLLKSFNKGWSGKVGVALLSFLILLALLAPVLPIEDPESIKEVRLRNNPPSFGHLFGTDEWGRDMLSRTIWGAQASLLECLGALLIAMFVGAIIGFVLGYYRDQPIGYLLDRVTDVFLSTPIIIVILFFPIETGSLKWILAVGLSTWAIVAKIVRSQVLVTMEKPYVESARAVGASDMRIFLTCILPDIANIIAANIVYIVSIVIAIQTSLDFFGFKRFLWSRSPELPPVLIAPVISWGSLLSYNITSFLALKSWWTVIPPLTCLTLLGLSLILIGNKLNEVLNPEARGI